MSASRYRLASLLLTPALAGLSRRLLSRIVACLLAASTCALAALSPTSPFSALDHVDVLVPCDFPGPTVPANFASFSLEPYVVTDWADKQPAPVSPILVGLMRQLHPTPRLGRPYAPHRRQQWRLELLQSSSRQAACHALRQAAVVRLDGRRRAAVGRAGGSAGQQAGVWSELPHAGNASVIVAQLQAVERLIGRQHVAAIGNEPDVSA